MGWFLAWENSGGFFFQWSPYQNGCSLLQATSRVSMVCVCSQQTHVTCKYITSLYLKTASGFSFNNPCNSPGKSSVKAWCRLCWSSSQVVNFYVMLQTSFFCFKWHAWSLHNFLWRFSVTSIISSLWQNNFLWGTLAHTDRFTSERQGNCSNGMTLSMWELSLSDLPSRI